MKHLCVLVPLLLSSATACSSGGGEATAPDGDALACAKPLEQDDVTLDPDEVREVAETHHRVLRMCYERSFELNPSLQGKITLNLLVNSDGTTGRVCRAESTLPDRQVVECVIHVFSQFRYGERARGAEVGIYPVIFSPE